MYYQFVLIHHLQSNLKYVHNNVCEIILHDPLLFTKIFFNLCIAASLLEALSNVILNVLLRIPKSTISSFIKVAIFLPLCGVFIVLNEIILLFNIHSLSI